MTARTGPSRFIGSMLGRFLTPRAKRLIFLSSLTAYIKDVHDPDNATLEKINEMFSLSENTSALKFPMQVSTRIWGGFDTAELKYAGVNCSTLSEVGSQKLAISQMRIVANRLIKYMPDWLRYESNESMRQDIFKLLNTSGSLQTLKNAK